MSVIRTGIVETPISTDELAPEVVTAASGASVTFSGIIRDHDSGRGVERLVYESHPLADQQLAEAAAAVARAHPEVRISVVHRVGELRIGDVALAAVVASAHRREAFAACAELIDEVKDKVAIWKHQYFSDGDDEWVGALE
ncbi:MULTISPECIES: molybdenum cofactor biosynthesis protein MoaE [Brevibacterium]|uniref:Molybdopterin biosynthesis MoaE protein n=2 Tax=Brevibacterium casei TaxID=33889 RepID=K9B752_9MICO|nr:molybdenum cofactor biosynthesis protein MoaE [Brevibacterium casei]NJE68550.1 molybdenum cofactor biosynthesis protein MoaE [Brevibacterium sp. LS14]EKU49600.1 molybdopterin biosynthesis MoaE protein [Brevibacterium casei S18]MBE4693690.1 molybdenum cofactor biosynthesis protein MoaE [Brevibacterium casei]MBE8146306.1 molybdenum cofactor biosynthesis protein MoaE [Brevibacterium casei]MBY3576813.1 molybdenum cofactor biosynthesis protein MoaE [Brevibacterium casei]